MNKKGGVFPYIFFTGLGIAIGIWLALTFL